MSKNKTYRKFAVTTMAAAAAVASVAPVVTAADTVKFSDVNDKTVPTKSTQEAIYKLVELGAISGYKDGTFKPGTYVQRGQVAEMFTKAFDLEIPANVEDVNSKYDDADKFFDKADYIAATTESEVFEGQLNNMFEAWSTISRQQMATVLGSYLKKQGFESDGSVKVDLDKVSASHKDNVQLLADLGITKETPDFRAYEPVTRAQFSAFLVRTLDTIEAEKNKEPAIESVSAINDKQVKVTFNKPLSDVDFTNFDLDGDLSVSNVELTGNTAVITASAAFTRDQEYTLSMFGILDEDGKEYPESKASFTWSVAEGVTVAFESSTLQEGEKTGLTVKDASGKEVKNATVEVTSFNTNVVKVNNGTGAPSKVELVGQDVPGTVDVEVKTTLPDGSVMVNTFKVTVKETVKTVANAGYTLLSSGDFSGAPYANTEAFVNYAPAETSLEEGSGAVNLYAFGETNGNPDTAAIDFTDAKKVTSSNAVVATAVKNGSNIEVDPLKAGTTTITVTMDDDSRQTYKVTVTEKPFMKDISVDATSVKLSDENVKGATAEEGVDAHTITVKALDQFKDAVANNAQGATPKVTVASSSDGLDLKKGIGQATIANDENIFSGSDASANFTIVAQKDTPVKNATVKVSYFADQDDAKPAVVKSINVNVNDIKSDAQTADIDVNSVSEIDVNAPNIPGAVDSIDFTAADVFALDKDGNRTKAIAASGITADLADGEKSSYVDVTSSTTLEFKAVSALDYMRAADTIDVDVKANGVTKRLPIAYKNTAIVPDKATVSTNNVSVELPNGTTSLTFDELIFGAIDADQLILDDATDEDITVKTGVNIVDVKNTAKNGGYLYNKPLVSITGTDGKALATGVNVYGTDNTASANTWYNSVLAGLTQDPSAQFTADSFDVDFAVANVNDASTIGGDALTDAITPGAGETTSFTLVINGIYTKDSVDKVEGTPYTSATDAQKAKHNLLSSPVQVNVSVTEEK